MNGTTQRPADRYGSPIVSQRTARLLGLAGVIAFLAVVVFVGIQVAGQPVKSEVLAYNHQSDNVIEVDYQLTMTPGTEATCRIQAMNEGRAQVGFVETAIPAQKARQSNHHVEISTQGEAVSAEILSCEPV